MARVPAEDSTEETDSGRPAPDERMEDIGVTPPDESDDGRSDSDSSDAPSTDQPARGNDQSSGEGSGSGGSGGSNTDTNPEPDPEPSVPDPDQPARGNDPSSGSERGSGGSGGSDSDQDSDPAPSVPDPDQPARGNDPSSGDGRGSGDAPESDPDRSPTDQPARGNDPTSGDGPGSGGTGAPDPGVPDDVDNPEADQPTRGNDPTQRPEPDDLETVDPDRQFETDLSEGQGAEEGPGSLPSGRTSLEDDLTPEQLETLRREGFDSLSQEAKQELRQEINRGADKLGRDRDDVSAAVVGSELLLFTGNAPKEQDIQKTIASDLESEFTSDTQYEDEDVAIKFSDGRAEVQLTSEAAAEEVASRYREMENVPDDAVTVTSDNEVVVNTSEVQRRNADLVKSQSMDQQVALANRTISGRRQEAAESAQSEAQDATASEIESQLQEQYPDAKSIEVTPTGDGSYEYSVKREQTRPRQEPATTEISGTYTPKKTEEQFGDFDWSFGMGGPGDEVERTIDRSAENIQEKGTQAADALFEEGEGVASKSGGAAVLRAIGRPDLARTYEESLRGFGKGTVEGSAAIANVPGMLGGVMEGAETIGYATEKTATGEGDEFVDQSVEAGTKLAAKAGEKITEQPWKSSGLLLGSLAGSYGVMSTASKVSGRAGMASRLAIQPGEEAAGYTGYYATRAAAGTRRAKQLFPQKEPLIFSEEAAIMAARRASSKAREAVAYSRANWGEFKLDNRGTAHLTGFESRGTESEVDEEPTEVEIEDRGPLSEVEDASEQKAEQLDYQTRRRIEMREEATGPEVDPEPGEFSSDPLEGKSLPETESRTADTPRQVGAGPTATQRRAYRSNINTEAEQRLEAAQEPEAKVQSELEANIESARRRYETAVEAGTMTDAAEMQEQAMAQEAEVATDQREAALSELATETGIDTEVNTEAETRTEGRSRAEIDQELEGEAELEQEFEFEFEAEAEAEAKTETEVETEAELEVRDESRIETDAESDVDESEDQVFDFSSDGDDSGSGQGPVTLDAGWVNKYATALAGGGLAEREVADDAEEGPLPLPTVAQEEGGENIEAVESFFDVKLDGDEGGGWL